MYLRVQYVCIFGCDVFICVVGMHVVSVCAALESWKLCVLWGRVAA